MEDFIEIFSIVELSCFLIAIVLFFLALKYKLRGLAKIGIGILLYTCLFALGVSLYRYHELDKTFALIGVFSNLICVIINKYNLNNFNRTYFKQ